MSRPPAIRPVDAMEMRLMREAGVPVRQCASYYDVSVATAMRVLRELRKRLGPEKFTGGEARHARQRARAHLFNSQIASRETD